MNSRLRLVFWCRSGHYCAFFLEVCIRADCVAFVQGLFGPEEADYSLQSALMDFCSLFTCFNVVKVVKVDRNVVKPAPVKS